MKKTVFCLMWALLVVACGREVSPETELRNEVEAYQATLPEDLGDGVIMNDCQLLFDEVLYVSEVDEEAYGLEDTGEMRKAIKASIAQSLEQERHDSDMRRMLELCVKTERGLGYQYVGDQTGETVTVHFTANELERLLNL